MEKFLTIMLVVHIAGGIISLAAGLVAIVSKKGSPLHRWAGKVYFAGMTAVFVGAVFNAFNHNKDFLLIVAVFSYYLTVRGYRVLFLKKLHEGQKANWIDWLVSIVSSLFIIALLAWGVWAVGLGAGIGVAAIVFGSIGASLVFRDVQNFVRPPKAKMHWWYSHIGSMGGSYISAVTAFIVVNVVLPAYDWVLWILPTLIGTVLIATTITKYKRKFERTEVSLKQN